MIDSINFVVKPVGDVCNLHCKYCYTRPEIYCGEPISVDKIKKFISLLERDDRFRHIKFTWHGGEPLIWGQANYEETFDFQKRHLSNKDFMNIFQTNGILLDQEYIDLIKKYNIYVGVSIDGPSYALNSNRFDSEKTFRRMTDNLELLARNDIKFAVFCTLTAYNIDHIDEIFDFIEAIEPYAYTFIPIMENESSITAEKWSDVLNKTNVFYKKTGIWHSYTKNLDSLHPKMCMMNGRCQSFVTIDNKGIVNKTCRINQELSIGNLKDEDILDKIASYAFKPLRISKNSIYSYIPTRKYIYFQGDGCYYRKQTNTNKDFIEGIVSYLKKH